MSILDESSTDTMRASAHELRTVLSKPAPAGNGAAPHVSTSRPGCEPGCLERWVDLNWAGAPVSVHSSHGGIVLRSPRMRIPALRPDFEQVEPPEQVSVYLQADIRYRPSQRDHDQRVQWLPTAIILDIDGRETRLDFHGAQALSDALSTLTEVTSTLADPPEGHPQPCLTCAPEHHTASDEQDPACPTVQTG